jgi:hypothetical protein
MDTKLEFVLDTADSSEISNRTEFASFNIALPISRDIYKTDMKGLGRCPESENPMAQNPPYSRLSVRTYSLSVTSEGEDS